MPKYVLKPPMETIQAIAIILGRKICFAPPDSICGFFSISLIEVSFECLSSCTFVRSCAPALIVVAAMVLTKEEENEVKLEYAGTPRAYKPALSYSMAP